MMKIRKTLFLRCDLLVIAVFIIPLLAGCVNRSVPYGNGKELAVGGSATVADLTAGSAMQEANRVQSFQSKEKPNYDRHYGNGLYFKDYTATKERLNQEFSLWMERQMAVELKKVKDQWIQDGETNLTDDTELIIHGKLECYNDILEQVQANNTSVEELLKEPAKNFRSMEAEIYSLENMMTKDGRRFFTRPCSVALVNLRTPIINVGIPFTVRLSAHERKALESKTIEELKKLKNLRSALDDYSTAVAISYYEGVETNSGLCRMDSLEDEPELQSLKTRYGEDFVLLYAKEDFSTFYAPKRDTTIKFQADQLSSRYLAVTAQKLASEAVNKVLEENGVADHVVQFTAPDTSDTMQDEIKMNFNVQGIRDSVKFLKKDFPQGFQTSLYYLHQEGEEINYEELNKICLSVGSALNKKSSLYIYFYTIDEMGQKVLVDLFKQHMASEYMFRPRTSGLDFSDMYRTRTDSEGFRFLDVYGERDEYMMSLGSHALDTTVSGKELFEKYKQRDICED